VSTPTRTVNRHAVADMIARATRDAAVLFSPAATKTTRVSHMQLRPYGALISDVSRIAGETASDQYDDWFEIYVDTPGSPVDFARSKKIAVDLPAPWQRHIASIFKLEPKRLRGYRCDRYFIRFADEEDPALLDLLTDWRFGRAPTEWAQLMQRRDDASAVTTDVSLRTAWNRLMVALTFAGFAAFLVIAFIRKEFKDEEVPSGAPSEEPAAAARGRSSFGKRHA
jgi:hypothetical protein